MNLPGISVLIPTLNASRYLGGCLESIRSQDYPPDLIEILIADAGSTDDTLAIAKRFGVDRVVDNPLVTGEAARAILNFEARRELILSVDSDNYLVGTDWLRRMVQPFQEDDVFAVEPLRWHYDRHDRSLNRYFSLSGINDPVSLFLGNYGRYSHLSGKWTEYPHKEAMREGYFVAELQPGHVPTLGANGYMARTEVVRKVRKADEYYFDIDAVADLVDQGYTRLAKVDVSIGHHFARDLRSLRRKTMRRIEDYLYFRELRNYPWTKDQKAMFKFVSFTLLTAPLLAQAMRGYRRIADPAWFHHVPVCWLTLLTYGWGVATSRLKTAPHSRVGWKH